jgi:hypothetical protein
MGSTNTDKLCTLGVEVVAKHEFKFLVPNHLVDENGKVDDEILEEITDKFMFGRLNIINEPDHISYQVKGDIKVLDEEILGSGLRGERGNGYITFGDEESLVGW